MLPDNSFIEKTNFRNIFIDLIAIASGDSSSIDRYLGTTSFDKFVRLAYSYVDDKEAKDLVEAASKAGEEIDELRQALEKLRKLDPNSRSGRKMFAAWHKEFFGRFV